MKPSEAIKMHPELTLQRSDSFTAPGVQVPSGHLVMLSYPSPFCLRMCHVIMACPQVSRQFNNCADILADVLFDQLSHFAVSASLNTG